MADSSEKLSIAKLNDSNYQLWKFKMQMILMRDGVWDNVNEPKPEAAKLPADWDRREHKAMAAIGLATEDSQLIHLTTLTSARDMWLKLQSIHERSSMCSKLYLIRRLYSMRFTSGTMTAHITAMLEIVNQLRGLGKELSDEDVVAALLCSLPETYGTLVTALEGRSEDDLTVEYIRGKLIDEYSRRVETSCTNEVALNTTDKFNSYKTKPNQTYEKLCKFCKKKGHVKNECWKLKRKREYKETGKMVSSDTHEKDKSHYLFLIPKNREEKKNNYAWYVDSGATSHMTSDKSFFSKLNDTEDNVFLANDTYVPAKGIGQGVLRCITPANTISQITVSDTLYVPSLEGGLLSVSCMTRHGFKVVFKDEQCIISKGNNIVATAILQGKLFKLKCSNEYVKRTDSFYNYNRANLWHRRMGHREFFALRKLYTDVLATGIDKIEYMDMQDCEPCIKGKMAQLSFAHSKSKSNKPLELIHSDLCGPMHTETPSGHKYILTLIDDFSRFTHVYFLTMKNEAVDVIKEYVTMVSNLLGYKPKVFRTDNGKEYVNAELKQYFKKEGIQHQFTVPYTPQQNGVAERKNRSLVEMAKCMLLDSNLPNRFWGEAVNTAAYLQNRLPSNSITKTPYEHWFGTKPDVRHIRIFGSKVYSFVPQQLRKKWDDKAKIGILVGFDTKTKGYRILDEKTNKVWISRSVRIIENYEPTPKSNNPALNTELEEMNENHPKIDTEEVDISILNLEEENCQFEGKTTNSEIGDTRQETESPETTQPRRSDRKNKGIPIKRLSYKVRTEAIHEPTSWKDMMSLPANERDKWIAAAREEIATMQQHDVWTLTKLPAGRQTISAKWVFKTKYDAIGHVTTYKARLVARGFSQKYGEDYDQTFAPVVKHETVRVLLAISAYQGLHVRHFDVKSAFLNGDLEETLYMQQPPGFVEEGKEDLVLKLKHSIYGLKQSARAWNKKATIALTSQGFVRSKADASLYWRKENDGSTSYILLYVDDLLVASKQTNVIYEICKGLNEYFITKDLGNASNYLGIQIEREDDGTFLLHQQNKIEDLIKTYNMENAKPVATPMEVSYPASVEDPSHILPNNTLYRQAIGSLLYIATVSRPDIAAAVGILCRRVSQPTERDWKAVKRVMRYLSGTSNAKLRLPAKEEPILKCYVDADWGGDKKDRKSTSGYIFLVGGGPVAWSSKKQSTVAISSTEAEYVAAAYACQELIWLRQLLSDMGMLITTATTVFEDNQGCISMIESDKSSSRTKHIDIKYHMLRDLYEKGVIEVKYCPTNVMMADMLTKPLPKDTLRHFASSIQMQF